MVINVDQAKVGKCYKILDQENVYYGDIIVIKHLPNGDILVIEEGSIGIIELFDYDHQDWTGLKLRGKTVRNKILIDFFDRLFSDSNFAKIIDDNLKLY